MKKYLLLLPQKVKLYRNKNYCIISHENNGNFIVSVPLHIQLIKFNNKLSIQADENDQLLNTFYILIKNLFKGFNKLHTTRLFLKGIGFRVYDEKTNIKFKIGFSHNIMHNKKNHITYNVYKNYFIDIKSPLKDQIGYESFLMTKLKTPDCYKAKGIHLKGVHKQTKIGKKS